MSTAIEVPLFKPGVLIANVDLSAKQFCGVKVVADLALGLPSAGGLITGVQQGAAGLGEAVELECSGITKALLSGTVAAGAQLMVDANGAFLLATTGNFVVAEALAPGVSGDIASIYLKPAGKI